MQDPVTQRFVSAVEELINDKAVESQKAIAKAMDFPHQYFGGFKSGKRKVSKEAVNKLITDYNVSAEFIWEGKGEIIKRVDKIFQISPIPEAVLFPFVPVPARASFIEMSGDEKSYGGFETYPVLYPPGETEGKRAFVIEVDGDSMEPQLKKGDKVLAVEVDKGDWCYQTSKVYAVAYGNTFVIKRISNNDLQLNNKLTLSSDNTKGGEITITGNELRGMWRVLKTVDSTVE